MHNNFLNHLNEARVERTIDPKLWASVNSGCSRTYKADLGASAKPMGTRDQLLARYVAGLIILKQPCPMTLDDMVEGPAFKLWGAKLVEMGIDIAEVHKLWNENCGKLPKVDATIMPADDEPPLSPEPEPMQEDPRMDFNAEPGPAPAAQDVVNADDIEIGDEVADEAGAEGESAEDEQGDPMWRQKVNNNWWESARRRQFMQKQETAVLTADPIGLIPDLYSCIFATFPGLYGCKEPDDAIKHLPEFNPKREGLYNSENLNSLMNLAGEGNVYSMRIYKGGDPEEVKGDVVWAGAPTETAYYIAVTDQRIEIYYKDIDGSLSLSWAGTPAELGFKDPSMLNDENAE